jgi:hypothetical protein
MGFGLKSSRYYEEVSSILNHFGALTLYIALRFVFLVCCIVILIWLPYMITKLSFNFIINSTEISKKVYIVSPVERILIFKNITWIAEGTYWSTAREEI